ncbi:ABC transporter permease [Macrococcoides canis]|uniref:ABC transporter permease n=1 Tax=Macrococcoides canis TaxID=1855823 RepID=UPI00207D0690|nr:ABC transporter permease [Macrococcus canis]MCO4097753.1 ABC transporter permease [Macrococcus canis]UTH06714.1 ABC transporter permease [Macrococcus canis]UTH09065.1 ABC transporter permease [Macrococcus canis]
MKINRIKAIARKDFKEFSRNMLLLTMPLAPIVLAVLYSRMPDEALNEGRPEIAVLTIGVALSTVLTSAMMTMLAEEKEKHTLRGLINSPATLLDILIGKSIVVSIITLISVACCLFTLKINIFIDVYMIIGFMILFGFFLLLGAGLGLYVSSVSETNAYILPITLIFGMSPMISMFINKEHILYRIANYLPLNQYIELAQKFSLQSIIVIGIWFVSALILNGILFKKSSFD